MENISVLEALRLNTFFGSLNENYRKLLSTIATLKVVKKGETIFREGELATSLFLIIDGIVKIFKISEDGKEHTIHIFGSGEVFAEVALAENQTYPAWAVALTDVRLAIFERTKLLKLLKENPELSLSMVGVCVVRLKNLVSLIENVKMRDAKRRVIFFLWEKSEKGKKETLDMEISKKEASILLGITPETFSRVLKKLKEEGVIVKTVGNRKIQVNLEELRKNTQI